MGNKVWTTEKAKKAIEIILGRISDGESVRGILSMDRDKNVLPSRYIFNEWLAQDKELQIHYARACEERADAMFEEMLEIADDSSQDEIEMYNGDGIIATKANHEYIQRSRLRVDTRKWMLGKMQPKKYGDKLDLTTDGNALPSPTIIVKDV